MPPYMPVFKPKVNEDGLPAIGRTVAVDTFFGHTVSAEVVGYERGLVTVKWQTWHTFTTHTQNVRPEQILPYNMTHKITFHPRCTYADVKESRKPFREDFSLLKQQKVNVQLSAELPKWKALDVSAPKFVSRDRDGALFVGAVRYNGQVYKVEGRSAHQFIMPTRWHAVPGVIKYV